MAINDLGVFPEVGVPSGNRVLGVYEGKLAAMHAALIFFLILYNHRHISVRLLQLV